MQDLYWIIILFVLVFNLFSFVIMGLDKWKAAHGKWRIPEATLFTLSFAGGALGIFLAMQLFRHKTKHTSFRILVPLALVLHILLILFIMKQSILG